MSSKAEIYKDAACIETQNITEFHLEAPKFHIEDIANALSQTTRFGGHGRHFYSVAEHSVLVSLLMEEYDLGDPYEGLMHDASEAYLRDCPAPFKHLMADAVDLEDLLDIQIREWAGLFSRKSTSCQMADWLALFIELWFLMPSKGIGHKDPHGYRKKAIKLINDGWHIQGMLPQEAKKSFLDRYETIRPRPRTH